MTVTKKQLAYLEELFSDYKNYDKKIALRKAELQIRETDENIGGGRSSQIGNPTETQIVREMSDPRIQFLQRCKNGVEFTMNHFEQQIVDVIEAKFFDGYGIISWEEVAEKTFNARSSVYRMRYMVLEVFGNYIGVLNTIDFK